MSVLINNTFRISIPNPPFSLLMGEPDTDAGEEETGECWRDVFRVEGINMGAKIRPNFKKLKRRLQA